MVNKYIQLPGDCWCGTCCEQPNQTEVELWSSPAHPFPTQDELSHFSQPSGPPMGSIKFGLSFCPDFDLHDVCLTFFYHLVTLHAILPHLFSKGFN